MPSSQNDAPPPDPNASPGGPSSSDAHAEQWAALTDLLGVSDPEAVVSRVRTLQENLDALNDRLAESDADAETAIQDIREQIEHLRDQNADLADRSGSRLSRSQSPDDLHPETEALLGQLDVASLSEAQERIRSLTTQVENLYREKEVLAEAGLMSSQEALDEIDRLQRECDRLRSQRDDASASSPDDVVAEILGIDSPEQARELDDAVRRLSTRLDTLADEKETLADNLGVADADAVLDLVQSMEAQLSDFYERREDERRETGDDEVPAKIESILGVTDAQEARELVSYVHAMNERLEHLSSQQETLAAEGLDAEKAVAIIDSMEEQLVDLYGTADHAEEAAHANGSAVNGASRSASSAPSVGEVLGLDSPEEAREFDQLVRRMGDELDQLRAETEKLSDADLTAESALQMIDSMEEQLVALYHAQDRSAPAPPDDDGTLKALTEVIGVEDAEADAETSPSPTLLLQEMETLLDEGRTALPEGKQAASIRTLVDELSTTVEGLLNERDMQADRAERLDEIEDILGISTLEEARDLTSLVQNLDEQLQSLYAERAKLNELGLSSVEDAVDMIRSMEHQLQELYQEQEALQEPSLPEPVGQQDTFEQLQSLYKEQEKLQRALGVSDADDIIEMVEDLTAQLDDAYSEQDPAPSASSSEEETASRAPARDRSAPPPATRLTLDSMRHQLEVIYTEREALLKRGIESAQEAAERIDRLEDRLQTVQTEHEACQERMDRLRDELGTADVAEIVQRVRASKSSPDWDDVPSAEATASGAANDDPFVDAAPSLLPGDTLDQLDEMSTDDLDDLSVGVLRLDDQGTIQALNETGLEFPGLGDPPDRAAIVGQRLFELVPGTSNALFLGRFRNGVEQGTMNARFPYTFVTPGDRPSAFFVHLYRSGDHQANWLLFRPA